MTNPICLGWLGWLSSEDGSNRRWDGESHFWIQRFETFMDLAADGMVNSLNLVFGIVYAFIVVAQTAQDGDQNQIMAHPPWKVVFFAMPPSVACEIRHWQDVQCDPAQCSHPSKPCKFRCSSNGISPARHETDFFAGSSAECREFVQRLALSGVVEHVH